MLLHRASIELIIDVFYSNLRPCVLLDSISLRSRSNQFHA